MLLCLVALLCYLVTSTTQSETQIAGSYRKDVFLSHFPEPSDKPLDGGRVHVVLQNSSCDTVTSVLVNSQEALNLTATGDLDFTYFDWTRFFQTRDGRIWLSFHSRNTDWLSDKGPDTLELKLFDSSGSCFEGQVSVAPAQNVVVSYVTTQSAGSELVVHIHNDGRSSEAVEWLSINGQQIDGPWVIGPQQTHIGIFPVQLVPGDIWTVSLSLYGSSQASPLGWGGRTIPERFAIEVWPHDQDCPIPTINISNWDMLDSAGIDTVYVTGKKCGDVAAAVSKLAGTGCDL